METSVRTYLTETDLRIMRSHKRRVAELKRNIFIFSLSVILFAILAILLFSTKSVASDGSETTLYKYYKSVQIETGDTLYGLADEYLSDGYTSSQELINDIRYINNIDADSILIAGCYIIVPYYDTYNG